MDRVALTTKTGPFFHTHITSPSLKTSEVSPDLICEDNKRVVHMDPWHVVIEDVCGEDVLRALLDHDGKGVSRCKS